MAPPPVVPLAFVTLSCNVSCPLIGLSSTRNAVGPRDALLALRGLFTDEAGGAAQTAMWARPRPRIHVYSAECQRRGV
eukprot:9500350-Pyramimonas_sp.AAC.4